MVRDQTENLLIFTHKILHHHNVPVWFVFADRNNHTLTSQEDCDEMRKTPLRLFVEDYVCKTGSPASNICANLVLFSDSCLTGVS